MNAHDGQYLYRYWMSQDADETRVQEERERKTDRKRMRGGFDYPVKQSSHLHMKWGERE